jgi:hypothetical protein
MSSSDSLGSILKKPKKSASPKPKEELKEDSDYGEDDFEDYNDDFEEFEQEEESVVKHTQIEEPSPNTEQVVIETIDKEPEITVRWFLLTISL